ncbi:dephospho-CoA kinase [Pararhodonellum marinum]|uniref:dephospho-CoA kinase n=1 Tax=Pararhodonellum marinum TaxID=2755358 RepID=UPI0018905394|nr:dephospho-CoA kinase [Pararhodonellum marinum]
MTPSKPKLIGLTGGIGSGKTTVAKIFSCLDIPVYYADDRAKSLMITDPKLKSEIESNFGKESYFSDGQLNRSFLANQVFSDPEKTKQINALIHPAVRKDFENWVNTQSAPYVLKEAALLFETGSFKDLDKTILVSSPLKIRVARILIRDPGRSEAQVNEIINLQLPDEEKIKWADYTIKNTDNKLLIPQVLKIHGELTK